MRDVETDIDLRPCAIVTMGVSGSGKSTLAACLAARLQCAFFEGDDFHAAASVAKMRAGQPLNDADRWPWLDRLGTTIGASVADTGIAVATCSALKKTYRQRLEAMAGVPLLFVLLDGEKDAIARRLEQRTGHYMPVSLLHSQLATLERPTDGERALTLDFSGTAEELCDKTLAWLAAGGAAPIAR